MPRRLELQALEAELAAVTDLLSQASETGDPVGVQQYAQRRSEIESGIESLRGASTHQASVALYFGGKPVYGSRGISAEFAGRLRHDPISWLRP